MNLKIYYRATKYIDKMLYSRRDNWCEKKLYIQPDVYLKIAIERVGLQDMQTKTYKDWERGTPHDLRISIVNKNDVELAGFAIRCEFHRRYRSKLSMLLDEYS